MKQAKQAENTLKLIKNIADKNNNAIKNDLHYTINCISQDAVVYIFLFFLKNATLFKHITIVLTVLSFKHKVAIDNLKCLHKTSLISLYR